MTTHHIGTERQVWGAPAPSPQRWGWRESAAAVAVAAVIAGLGGAAIYAATTGTAHPVGGPQHLGGPPPGGFGGPGPAAIGPTSLHGEFVVSDGAGGYTTQLTQSGSVTAVSPTSITVRSEDGHSQTYVIPPTVGGTGTPFAVNDQVTIRATRTGDTATMNSVGSAQPQGRRRGLSHSVAVG